MPAIANYVELRRTKVNRKELKIDRTMQYGQSRLINWDPVVEVKEGLLANPPLMPDCSSWSGTTKVWECRFALRLT